MTQNANSSDNPTTKTGLLLRYTQDGRAGTIYYRSPEASFDVWYEFAMPPAIVIIGIPEPRYWEARTKTPLSQRIPILQFIGERVIEDKLFGAGYARIEQDNIMTIFGGRDPDTI